MYAPGAHLRKGALRPTIIIIIIKWEIFALYLK